LCALVNDLRVCERVALAQTAADHQRPAEMRYRYLLGVKWSQVQILSARPEKCHLSCSFQFLAIAHTFDGIENCHRLSQEIDWCHRTRVRTI
jgi:hypothetical protein